MLAQAAAGAGQAGAGGRRSGGQAAGASNRAATQAAGAARAAVSEVKRSHSSVRAAMYTCRPWPCCSQPGEKEGRGSAAIPGASPQGHHVVVAAGLQVHLHLQRRAQGPSCVNCEGRRGSLVCQPRGAARVPRVSAVRGSAQPAGPEQAGARGKRQVGSRAGRVSVQSVGNDPGFLNNSPAPATPHSANSRGRGRSPQTVG